MQPPTETTAYVRRLVRTAADLDLHPFFLDALVNQLVTKKQCSRHDFLYAYFLRLFHQAAEALQTDLQSPSPATRVRAAARMSRLSLIELGHLNEEELDLVARYKTNSGEFEPFTRLHWEMLGTARRDLQNQVHRFKATSFTGLLQGDLGPHLAALRRLRSRMEGLPATGTETPAASAPHTALAGGPPHHLISLALANGMTIIREAMREVLVHHPQNGFTVIGEAATGQELMDLLKTATPDVVIIDVNTPGPNGIDTAAWVRENYPGIRVLAFSQHNSPVEVELMARAGATGFIGSDASIEELFYAIRAVHAGGVFFGKSVPTKLLAGAVAELGC